MPLPGGSLRRHCNLPRALVLPLPQPGFLSEEMVHALLLTQNDHVI